MKFLRSPKPNKDQAPPASQLRQDIITGDWVVIATGRAKRPSDFREFRRDESDPGIEHCPFEHPEETGQEPDTLTYRTGNGDWSLRVFPNKYPALSRGQASKSLTEGPYFAMTGTGYHEVIVPRDHYCSPAFLETWSVAEMLDAYQERYLSLMKKKSIKYIQVFHNHGKEAGASLAHPHSQLMALPVVSPYIMSQLRGAELYHKSHRRHVYQTISDYELETGARLIYENERFAAFCPFASRAAFEVWIAPKRAAPYFERLTHEDKLDVADALRKILRALYDGLGDPPYNFFVNTSPCDGRDYPHYGWHIEILPHTAVWAGFELSTGIEISTIQPEVAAEYLKSQIT